MVETKNKYFNYPGKELWNLKSKKVPEAVMPLATKLSEINNTMFKVPAKPENEQRHDGYYNSKAFSYFRDDMAELLHSKGLHYYQAAMVESTYITVVPESHMKTTGYDQDIDTVIVMASCDISDPNYAMYTLERYMDYIDMAERENKIIHFVMYRGWDNTGRMIWTLHESMTIHRFNLRRLYLDITNLVKAGVKLSSIEGLTIPGYETNPDDAIEYIGSLKIPCVNIADMHLVIGKHKIGLDAGGHNMDYNLEAHLNTMAGKRKAMGMLAFKDYEDPFDPALHQKLWDMGVEYTVNETDGERWVCLLPRQSLEDGRKVPVIGFFEEVNAYDPGKVLHALSSSYNFIELVAEGNFALIMFADEDPDSNDLMAKLITEAADRWPIDLRRVYITGLSHNGRFAAEFARRHQKLVAAVAPTINEPGQLAPEWTSGFFAVSDEQLALQASVDTPVLIQCGCCETNCMYPLYTDAPNRNPSTPFIALDTKAKRIKSWQRRLISSNCPMKTEEEICATEHSSDYVERTLGIPADKTEVLFADGGEIYIADIKNNDGNYHLRICGYQNTSHGPNPYFANMMWSWCRRFARDQETGETIELFKLK